MSAQSTDEAISLASISSYPGRQRSTSTAYAEDRAVNKNGGNGDPAAAFHGTSRVPSAPGGTGATAANGPSMSCRGRFSSSLFNSTSGGSVPIAAVSSNTGVGSGVSTQSRVRPTSLQYRQPSSVLWGELAAARGRTSAVGSAGNNNNNNNTSAVTNVYTLQLPGDDGGVEMAAAQPRLLGALRMRETYKDVDKGHCEVNGGGSSSSNSNGGVNRLASVSVFAAEASRPHSQSKAPRTQPNRRPRSSSSKSSRNHP
ncbi:hypothetical_protein (plasmid) [Leishmania braziliensis MHOM/BR/75/M2904]|uniref:Hypothetical_protein n=1 Tax=Leishmania braziliensis MHOM/BR/75/M2904 TaxID=420245 RepID=A0A3P3YXC6_LEIBR|nr:hypothetical_protein [Leishmania braziliensis MHOM/BR/75/M2904]